MGAPKGNLNGLKHGAFAKARRKINGRSTVGVAQRRLRAGIEKDLGGRDSLSCSQLLLVDRGVTMTLFVESMEAYALSRRSIFKRNGELIGCLGKNYLAYCESLRRILMALGLERRAKDVPSLQAYLAARGNQATPSRAEPGPYQEPGEQKIIDGQGSQESGGVNPEETTDEDATLHGKEEHDGE